MVNHAISLFYNNKYALILDDIIGELYAKKDFPSVKNSKPHQKDLTRKRLINIILIYKTFILYS